MKKSDYRPIGSPFETDLAHDDHLDRFMKLYTSRTGSVPYEEGIMQYEASEKKHNRVCGYVEILKVSLARVRRKLSTYKNRWKMRSNRFSIINDEGKHVKCKILFTFDSAAMGKSYIVFTDDTKDEDGNTNVYSAVYDPEGPRKQVLASIEDPQELKHIESIMNNLVEMFREGRDHPEYFV